MWGRSQADTNRMSKITFRADEDLVARLEEYDASKSEIMREALRAYFAEAAPPRAAERPDIEGRTSSSPLDGDESIDAYLRERIDTLVERRVDALIADRRDAVGRAPRDVTVTVSVDGEQGADGATDSVDERRKTGPTDRQEIAEALDEERKQCEQCGEHIPDSAVYCSNCGEKTSHRVFCNCGDELRSDWRFCPGCGRRTPAADILDNGDP